MKQAEVLIIGGSFAGLAAGMTLGRSIRKVLILDSGQPCNRQTPHSHGFLTQDGEPPASIWAKARSQVLHYPTVRVMQGKVITARRSNEGFTVGTESGENFSAKKLLIATGIKDLMPEIPGFAQCWGISVLHCPYCHGYEVRGQKLGLLGNGDAGYELVRLLYQWSKHLILFTNGPATLSPEQRQKLAHYQIPVVETAIGQMVHDQGYIQQMILADGSSYSLNAVFARVAFTQHSDIAAQLGCEHTPAGHIATNELGLTTIPGVYAAGDATTMMRALSVASAAGHIAASGINRELITESF